MSYRFKSKDGLCESNNAEFVSTWNNIVDKQREQKAQWIADLRSQGVKAAHPDDGWVDRNANTVLFSYPQFNDGVEIGDTIALGWPHDKTRLVRVVSIEYGRILTEPRYKFEPIVNQEKKKTKWWSRLIFGKKVSD